MKFVILNEEVMSNMIKHIGCMRLADRIPVVEITDDSKRTDKQNNALHVYCELLAEALNDAGLDMRAVIRPEVDIPWSKESVKEHLWKPIQNAVIDKESTTQADRSEYNKVFEVLSRHLGEKLGLPHIPWPSRWGD